MSTFVFTLDLNKYGHDHSLTATRTFVQQKLHEVADAIGKGYVEPHARQAFEDRGDKSHPSWSHESGEITASEPGPNGMFHRAVIGTWSFIDSDTRKIG